MSNNDFHTQCVIMTLAGGGEGFSPMTVWNSRNLFNVHVLQFASLIFNYSSIEKDHLSIKKGVKNLWN